MHHFVNSADSHMLYLYIERILGLAHLLSWVSFMAV